MMRYYEVSMRDEAPSIGSGRRYVLALEGRKWAQLVTPTLHTGRVPLAKWHAFPKREIDLTATQRRRLRRVMREWRRYRPRTRLVKRAERAVAA